jgi:hypothetical protein
MSEIKVNKISQRSGTAITLGNSGTDFQLPSGADIVAQSGSTITIAAGATITNSGTATGFGATGAVNWDTTAKTTGFNAVSGVGYFCNTTSAAFTMTLPSTPTAGNIVGFSDYAGTWDTNSPTIGRNGSNINGAASDFILTGENTSVTLIYVDVTQGWKVFPSGLISDVQSAKYVAATGGTITTSGDFKIHTFTGPGTFTVTSAGNPLGSNVVDYLVVAGGGGGGATGGGGGGGGFRVSNSLGIPAPTMSPLTNPTGLPVSVTGYPITVGSGGTAPPFAFPGPAQKGGNGNNSVFSTITSTGGGGGSGSSEGGSTGGSGGGGGATGGPSYSGLAGNTPPVSPPQGNDGGNVTGPQTANNLAGAGGGGAGAVGSNVPAAGQPGGNGGIGSFVSPSLAVACAGTTGPVPGVRYFAGGGGGGVQTDNNSVPAAGSGGSGGGGAGVRVGGAPPAPTPFFGTPGTANTGGAGGGGGRYDNGVGGSGGSGIVIIRYKFQ